MSDFRTHTFQDFGPVREPEERFCGTILGGPLDICGHQELEHIAVKRRDGYHIACDVKDCGCRDFQCIEHPDDGDEECFE